MTSSGGDDIEVRVFGVRRSTDASTPRSNTSPVNERTTPGKLPGHGVMSPMSDEEEEDPEDVDAWISTTAVEDQLRPLMRRHHRRSRSSSRSSWSSRSRSNYSYYAEVDVILSSSIHHLQGEAGRQGHDQTSYYVKVEIILPSSTIKVVVKVKLV